MKYKLKNKCRYLDNSYECNYNSGSDYCGIDRKFNLKSKLTISLFIFLLSIIILSSGVIAVGTYPAVDPNMVLYYHFNNDSAYGENDTHVYDFSGNGNNGTANNTLFQAGTGILNDGSFYFNGDISNFVNGKTINYSGLNYTYSAWIKRLGGGGGTEKIVGHGDATSRSSFEITKSNKLLRFTYYNGSNSISLAGNSPINNDVWTYVSLVVKNNTVNFYINGILDREYLNVNDMNNKSFNVMIGSRAGLDSQFNGSIDEVIIYNKSLQASEIWSNYHNYLGCINITSLSIKVRDYTKICGGNYFYNGSNVINILTNNTYLNFTGTHFQNNGTGNFVELYSLNNITFYGLNVSNYQNAIYSSKSNNINFLNSQIDTKTNNFLLFDDTNNVYINNSYFGYFNSSPTVSGVYFRFNSSNNLIENSYFKNCTAFGCIKFSNNHGINNIIRYNYLSGDSSILIEIFNSSNININNNILNNSNNNFDSYNVGIHIFSYNGTGSTNISLTNNNFLNIGCVGILTQGVNNLNIFNNNFSYNIDFSVGQKANCAYEGITAIDLASIWKTWTSDGTEDISDTVTKILKYSATNVNISGNSFNGFPVLLRTSSPINLTQDLSNYWLRSFSTPNYLMPRQDYYISNNFENVSTTFNISNNNPVIVRDLLGVGYPGYSTNSNKVFFKVYKDYLYFYNNFSITGVDIPIQISTSVFNQTNSLLTNGTSLCNGSSGLMTGNINITLNPNEYCYVLDNFDVQSQSDYNKLVSLFGTEQTLNIYGLLGYTMTENGLANPTNPFFTAFVFIYNIGGVIILIALAGLTLATFKFKKLNIYEYVSAVMGILISAWILGSILSAVS